MRPLLAAIAFASLALIGCKSDCRKLSEKLCECIEGSIEKEACLRRASAQESAFEPTAAEQDQCLALIETCDCNRIDTVEGKVACGLARPRPQP